MLTAYHQNDAAFSNSVDSDCMPLDAIYQGFHSFSYDVAHMVLSTRKPPGLRLSRTQFNLLSFRD